MKFRTFFMVATFAATLALGAAATPAHADECDDIVAALHKHGEDVMKARGDAKTPPALCTGFGQVLGIMQSVRIVASECFEEGKKRDDLVKDMDESAKAMEEAIASTCK